MKYFNNFTKHIFEKEDVDLTYAQPPVKGKIELLFRNSFGYNKKINEENYNKNSQAVLNQLKEFIEKNTKDNKKPVIKEINIASRGSASWVNTNYENKDSYSYENNQQLANDRGKLLSDKVLLDVKNYLAENGYDVNKIKFNQKDVQGVIDNINSKKVLNSFIKKYFENNHVELVKQMREAAKNKPAEVAFFKPTTDELKTRPEYLNDDKFKVPITLEDKNADKIYNLLVDSPAYVTYTAKLKSGDTKISEEYKKFAQNAEVRVTINESVTEQPTEKPPSGEITPEKFNIQSIPFQDDTTTFADNTQYNNLVNILKEREKYGIRGVVLIGHAEADDELLMDDKPATQFRPGYDKILYDTKGNKTVYTESQLAAIRFLLSIERAKKVTSNLINNIPDIMTDLTAKNLLGVYAFGTKFAPVLSNPKIVQIILLLKDNSIVNSEKIFSAKDFPEQTIKGNNVSIQTSRYMKSLGYNVGKFYNKYVIGNQIKTPIIPSATEFAKATSQEGVNKFLKFMKNT